MAGDKGKIKLDPKNAREHNDLNKALINKSLTELGPGRSILLDNENYVIAGNGVFEQAESLGIPIRVIESNGKELIAIKRTDLKFKDKKRKEMSIVDNSATDQSSFKEDMFVDEHYEEVDWEEWGVDAAIEPTFEGNNSISDNGEYAYPEGELEASHVRMIQLFLNTESEPEMREYAEGLGKIFKTNNITDTILNCMKWLYQNKKKIVIK